MTDPSDDRGTLRPDLDRIEPGVGVGDIRIGMPPRLLEYLLEKPDEIIAQRVGDHEHERWRYDRYSIMPSVDRAADRVTNVVVYRRSAMLGGYTMLHRPLHLAMRRLVSLGYIAPDTPRWDDEACVEMPERGIGFKCQSGVLRFVQVMPFHVDGQPVWPDTPHRGSQSLDRR